MLDRLISVHPNQPLSAVAQTLTQSNLRYLVVTENGKAIGVVSDRDVIRGVASGSEGLTARDIMSETYEPIADNGDSIFYLREQEINFKAVIENCNDILVIIDRSWRFVYCTPSASRVLGFLCSDVLNHNAFEFVHPEDVDLIASTLQTALERPNQTLPSIEFRAINYKKEWQYFEASVTNLLEHPAIQGIVALLRDITVRKDLEKQKTKQITYNQILTEMMQMLHQSFDLGQIFDIAMRRLRELIGVDRVEITKFYAEQGYWEPICESRLHDRIPSVMGIPINHRGNPFAERIVNGETVQINDSSCLDDSVNRDLAELFPGAWLSVPIVVNDKVWGVVSLDFHQRTYEWTKEDVSLAEIAVKQLAIAIERSELFQQITIERKALAESEERLRLALDFSKTGCWEVNIDDFSANWSDSLYALLGLDPETTCPGYPAWKATIHPEDRAWVEESFELAIQTKTDIDVSYRIVQPSGEVRWVLSKGKAVYRDEKPEKILGVMIDITDRKHLELSLAKNEERLSLVLKLNKIGIWDWDLTTNTVTWSAEKYELLGLSPETTASYDAFMALVIPEHRAEIEAQIQQCLVNHQNYYQETQIITPAGEKKWLREQARCQVKDGKVVRLLGLAEDITLSKQIELALIESEERYRNITENIPGVVMRYLLNDRGQEKIIYASQRTKEVFEIAHNDLVKNNNLFWNLMTENELYLFHGSILASAQNTKTWNREYQITTPSGMKKWIQGVGNPKLQSNGTVIWDMVMLDITDRKQIEARLKLEEKFTQQIMQLTSAIIYIYDKQSDSVSLLNLELNNITGLDFSVAKLSDSKLFQSLIHPHDRELVKQHWLQLLDYETPTTKEIEFRITDRSGQWHWLTSRDRLFNYDQEGRPTQILGVAIDITKQKQIEADLKESKSKFKQLAANIPGVILRYLVRPDGSDQILYISPGCYQIFNKTDQEILQNDRLFWQCVLAEDLPSLYSSFLVASQRLEQWKRIWRIKTEKGLKWLSGIASPDLLPNGNVVWDAIILDITDQKKAEAQSKQQEEILKQVAESASIIIYVYDLVENRNIYVNPEIQSLLGYSPQEVQDMGEQMFINLAHPDDLPRIQASLTKILQGQNPEMTDLEYRLRDKQGNWHWLFSCDRVIQRDEKGIPTQILRVAVDVTRLKLAETSLQQINQELEARIADRTRTLEEQLNQELLLRTILENIHHSFDLSEVFYNVLNETRLTFACDRVAVYQFNQDGSGRFVADSFTDELTTIVGHNCLEDIYLQQLSVANLDNPYVLVVKDTYASVGQTIEILPGLEIKASLVTPIYLREKLWGAIVIYEHYQPRKWQLWEVNLIQQIALHTAIAIQQSELHSQLTNELQQKNVLLKEVHHRVKNNLQIMSSLLRMQFHQTAPDVKDMIETYQTRIQAMALVHEQLYCSENFASIDLKSYITKLASYLLLTYAGNTTDIKLNLQIEDVSLPLERTIPLGLLVNELVTNAFKYAFPQHKGTVTLGLSKQEKMLKLVVADDGVGLPQGVDIFNLGSLGMQLVESLVEQIEGNLSYHSTNGTEFVISFPL